MIPRHLAANLPRGKIIQCEEAERKCAGGFKRAGSLSDRANGHSTTTQKLSKTTPCIAPHCLCCSFLRWTLCCQHRGRDGIKTPGASIAVGMIQRHLAANLPKPEGKIEVHSVAVIVWAPGSEPRRNTILADTQRFWSSWSPSDARACVQVGCCKNRVFHGKQG